MAQREQSHPGPGRRSRRRRLLGWVPELLVLVILGTAVAGWRFDLAERWPGPTPAAGPARVPPPQGLRLPALAAAGPVAATDTGGQPSAQAVARAVSPYLRAKRLGPHVVVEVADLADGRVLFRHGSGAVVPASTTKLLTTTAALQALGPMARFSTAVRQLPGTGQVVLVGGGDPFLASSPKAARGLYPARADLTTLAHQTAAALLRQHRHRVQLTYDATLFTGPDFDPDWRAEYRADVVAPISALWVDEGHNPSGPGFASDPARTAADLFARVLARDGVRVMGRPRARPTPAGSVAIAEVRSAPVGEIVQQVLDVSDNMGAEVLARHVGLAESHQGSFRAATGSVLAVLRKLGVDTAGDILYDGSGLSRRDRITARTLVDVLRTAASPRHPQLREVVTGLPVAGFTGSLTYRFDQAFPAARGRVRAKTGTLTGVHGLAGIATDVDGDQLAFVVVADRVRPSNELWAQNRLDEIAGALGACRCAG